MEKVTAEGLPILTEEVYEEVLAENVNDLERTTIEYTRRFVETNPLVYRIALSLAELVYPDPKLSKIILEDFPVGYEMLRRAGERLGLSPELPLVSKSTSLEESERICRNPDLGTHHIHLIERENQQYFRWVVTSTAPIAEKLASEFAQDYKTQQVFIYHLLRSQAIKNIQIRAN